jgi:hypothetical protein
MQNMDFGLGFGTCVVFFYPTYVTPCRRVTRIDQLLARVDPNSGVLRRRRSKSKRVPEPGPKSLFSVQGFCHVSHWVQVEAADNG